ncbi:TPA: hypothetical protein RTK63_005322 [Vibrio harveyi]|nr:hypothetical protein [Vibrio harveyi]
MTEVDWTGTPEIRYGLLPSGLAAQFPTRTIWALGESPALPNRLVLVPSYTKKALAFQLES